MARIEKFHKNITDFLDSQANIFYCRILYCSVSGVKLSNINNTDLYINNTTNRNYSEEIIGAEPFVLIQSTDCKAAHKNYRKKTP